jgi:hypothetical protein
MGARSISFATRGVRLEIRSSASQTRAYLVGSGGVGVVEIGFEDSLVVHMAMIGGDPAWGIVIIGRVFYGVVRDVSFWGLLPARPDPDEPARRQAVARRDRIERGLCDRCMAKQIPGLTRCEKHAAEWWKDKR